MKKADKKAPLSISEQRSRNMRAVKNKNSEIEVLLGKSLWKKGLRYRKNYRKLIGTPDFVLSRYKIAIFADSEFWHGKDWEKRKHDHKTNQDFWIPKIERNIERDKEVNQALKKEGWVVLRFWGKEIKKRTSDCVARVESAVEQQKKQLGFDNLSKQNN